MQRIKHAVSVAIGSGLVLSVALGANATVPDCTGCSMAQIESMAPACSDLRGRLGAQYISDFAAGNLYLVCYTVQGTQIKIGKNSPASVQPQPRIYHWSQPDALVQNQFQAYYDVYRNNGHVQAQAAAVRVYTDLRPKVDLGADDGYMNAYDTVRASANNNAVLDWLNSTSLTSQRVSNLPGSYPFSPALSAALLQLLNSIKTGVVSFNFNLRVELVFNDGSSREYTVDATGNWATVPNTAKDGHRNSIPETYNAIANNGGTETYGFGGAGPSYDQGNFATMITLYGIPVSNGGGSATSYTCTWNEATNTLSCVVGTMVQ